MIAALAIAATSEILRSLIEDTLQKAGQALAFDPPAVTIGSPPGGAPSTASVNLFLCQAVPNPAFKNAPGFTRGTLADRLEGQPLQLDLSYLVSAHGESSSREVGLGAAIDALRQTPAPSSERIRAALTGLAGDEDPLRRALADASVADGFENLTIKAQSLGIDSTAGLWIATQAPFGPSAMYVVTIVFNE